MLKNKFNKDFYLIILISVILSAAGWFHFGNPADTISGDAGYYWDAINHINENISNILFSKNIGIVESLNVIILGVLSYLPINIFIMIYIFQIMLYSLTAVIIYKFSLEFIGKKGAIFVLIFYFINYRHIHHIFILKPGVWVNFLLAITILIAYYTYKSPKELKYWIIFGVSSGFLILQDMRYIPHIGILVFTLSSQLKPYKENIKRIPVFIIFVIITISPWIIRQTLVFDRFIFISDMGTISIHKAFNTDYYKKLGENYKYYENMSSKEQQEKFYILCDSFKLSPAELIYSIERGRYDKFRTQKVNEKHEKLISAGILTRDEVDILVHDGESKSKFRQYFEYGLSMWIPLNWGYRYEPMTVEKDILGPFSKINYFLIFFTSGVFIPFIMLTIFYNIKRKNIFALSLLFIFFIHTLIHIVTYVVPRYLLPLLPFVTVIAYQGILQIFEIYKNRRNDRNRSIFIRKYIVKKNNTN